MFGKTKKRIAALEHQIKALNYRVGGLETVTTYEYGTVDTKCMWRQTIERLNRHILGKSDVPPPPRYAK